MAVDWLGHGLLLSKCTEQPGIFEVNARRFIAFDSKSLEYMVKYSVKRLQSEFPDYEIEVKHGRTLFGRSVEIKGRHKESGHNRFWIKYTPKRMYAKIYGLDPEIVMNCAL
jgi:hypothetical protein